MELDFDTPQDAPDDDHHLELLHDAPDTGERLERLGRPPPWL